MPEYFTTVASVCARACVCMVWLFQGAFRNLTWSGHAGWAYAQQLLGKSTPKVPPASGQSRRALPLWGQGLGGAGSVPGRLVGRKRSRTPEREGEGAKGRLRGLLKLLASQHTLLGKGDQCLWAVTYCSPASPTHSPPRGPQGLSIKSALLSSCSDLPEDRFQGRTTCPLPALTSCVTALDLALR